MRRWLSIVLLVLLPLQFSWAVAATYCEHESGTSADSGAGNGARHFGHHEHQHQPPAGQSGDASKAKSGAGLDVADCHFHCTSAADLPVSLNVPVVRGPSQLTAATASDSLPPVLPRPERPRWVSHA